MNLNKLTKLLIWIFALSILLTSIYAPWWDGNWNFKQPINVTSTITTPQNYTVEIILNSTNVGSGWNWNNECSENKTTARFIESTQTNELPFWVQNCNPSTQNASIWVRIPDNITSSGVIIYLYYNNLGATYKTNGSGTFDYFINFTGLTQESEGSGQDDSGNHIISSDGTQINFFGNTWKVYSGFTSSISISNAGNQILELDMTSQDCGEISSIKFDTNRNQENSANYRWCGSQTNWGIVPDQTYSGSGNWEEVYSVLNDFSITATHLHIAGDDDADDSTNSTYRNIRIRKYISTEPTFTIGTEEGVNLTLTSLSPQNDTTIAGLTPTDFTCIGVGSGTNLSNISIYETWSTGSWNLNETISVGNLTATVTFNKSLPYGTASYQWNCEVVDESNAGDFFDTNYTINVDSTLPGLEIYSPLGTLQDVTPTINVSANENLSELWINVNSQNNITLCNNCISVDDYYLHLGEGTHNISIYFNDTVGNFNTTNYSFTIDMNENYFDSFNDNSSFKDFNGTNWNVGNITYNAGNGIDYYQGVEIGIESSNMNYHANQWGGSGNAGEIDITCPGGDTACWFVTQNGTNISGFDISNGLATQDGASYQGFIMYSVEDVHTRFSPSPHNDNADNFAAVCYISGQWYYDDNNGCNEAFTPIGTDILVANFTAGISSVNEIIASPTPGNTTLYSKEINVTDAIFTILNITWNETSTDSNNTINIELTVDGGNNWYNATNGFGIVNVSNGTSLIYRINFVSDGITRIGINDINISWQNYVSTIPEVTLISPINGTKIFGDGIINLTWIVNDNENNISCVVSVDNITVYSNNCTTGINSNYSITLSRGFHIWSVNVTDINNDSAFASSNFTIILNKSIRFDKSIRNVNTNQYFIETKITNGVNYNYNFTYLDFVPSNFTLGSETPSFSFFNITNGPNYFGRIYAWNTNTTNPQINYSLSGIGKYHLEDVFILGGEIK